VHALRIDDALWAAALARARAEGRTLTAVISAALEAYVAGRPGSGTGSAGAALSPASAVSRQPRGKQAALPGTGGNCGPRRRCPHPGTRVIGGWCGKCDALVETGGYLPG
jgi:hypothetical protein